MKLWFLILLLFIFTAGCITSEVPAGAPGQYELPGIDNTTIYYLNASSVKVVDSASNETTIKYMLDDSTEMNFKDPVAVNSSGMNVSFNVTSEPIFGRSYIRFDFSSEFSGFVAFTQSDGLDFVRTTKENTSVRVVLPPGHTTGSRFLGIPTPEPDNVTTDAMGREVLIWQNPYPYQISVKYYQKGAPVLMYYFSIILIVCVVVISGYYYLSIRSLRKKRGGIENTLKKK
ncbi:MAG: hypothetical protein D4R88_09425 [Methanosarcinales archaeon]|nr:MAG: hypothetical protein D4R88_09425 [Methanosarcinales archaeon]